MLKLYTSYGSKMSTSSFQYFYLHSITSSVSFNYCLDIKDYEKMKSFRYNLCLNH